MVSSTVTPTDLGLPSKFPTFRPGQFEAACSIIESDHRFVAGAYPTGSGKSMVAVTSHFLYGGRTVILTSTKMLAEQYLRDFSECGMVEMRGQSNFDCPNVRFKPHTCTEGKAVGCEDRRTGFCPYIQRRQDFIDASLSVTNYDYYLTCMIHGEGCGDIDVLILDEAHTAVQQLSDAVTIKLEHFKYEPFYQVVGQPEPAVQHSNDDWKEWAKNALRSLGEAKRSNPDLFPTGTPHFELFKSTLSRMSEIESDWVNEYDADHDTTSFSPVWPTKYAKKYLFGNAKKVLMVSATIVPKTLTLLDITDDEQLFLSSRYQFPIHRAPVYLFGEYRLDYKAGDPEWGITLGRMDSLIDRRMDRKAIIHSVSYKRQSFLYHKSRHTDIMLAPPSHALKDEVATFRLSDPPCILNSPAITTGYDFAFSDCEYQFICKFPFVDGRGAINKARKENDPEYLPYLAAQTFQQMCGRPMRDAQDQCETFVMDKHANWFLGPKKKGGYRHLFANWFLPLIVWRVDNQPIPPLSLSEQGITGMNEGQY